MAHPLNIEVISLKGYKTPTTDIETVSLIRVLDVLCTGQAQWRIRMLATVPSDSQDIDHMLETASDMETTVGSFLASVPLPLSQSPDQLFVPLPEGGLRSEYRNGKISLTGPLHPCASAALEGLSQHALLKLMASPQLTGLLRPGQNSLAPIATPHQGVRL